MSRLKLLAAAMLLAVPIISACGEDPPAPPPTGTIDGLVSVEGQGLDGISVTLSNGAVATTANGGMFRFDGVEAGAYTVTIGNYPDDASFAQTSLPATIATDGETLTVNFPGTWIRTSAIMGTVTVENEGLSGVTVTITGVSDSETLTDANGQYAFTGLRAGNYTVEISGFDEDDVAFGSVASTAELAVGESKVVPFEGTYLRTSAITGQVSVEGTGLENVTVSMQGRGEERTATTNAAGQYTFSELRSGDYSVGITNPNADQYGFDVTSKNVTISHGETASVPFDGILLRTAAIMGTVTVEGTGIENVTVSVQGEGAELETMTNAVGQFSFTELHAGDYSIGITGFDDDLYGFDVTTATATVALQETATVPFTGIMLRTAGIAGTVTVEGHAIPGVTVTVTGGPKDEEHTRTTNDAGYYMVDELHAGDYAVAISDFDANEYEFEATTQSISVGLRETATVAFQGELLRTAGISGRVSVEGVGLDGVMVTLSGDADMTAETADGGQYAFTGLAAGDYMVAIAGWDEDAYSFDMTSAELAVADDAAVVQNFEGAHTRTASVSGMLFLDEVDGDGMYTDGEPAFAHAGIPLLLQGPGINDVQFGMSMPDGSYAFDGLMAGSYRVLINMSDTVAAVLTEAGFRFAGELTGHVVSVAAASNATVNFPFRIVMQTIFAGAVMGNATTTGHPVAGVGLEMYPTAEDADAGTNVLGMATTDTTGHAKFDFPRAMDLGPGGHGNDHLVFVKVTGTGHADLVVSDNAHIEIEYAPTDRVSMAPTAARLLNQAANFQWWIKSDENAKDGNEPLEGWKVIFGTDTITTDGEGKATYSGTVGLGAMPATMTVMADTAAQDDTLTMGEKWTQSAALKYTHNPMALPAMNTAEMNDLGPIYITYTTQRLTVGVYREADDEEGYTDYRSGLTGPQTGDHRPHASVAAEMNIELLARDSRNRLRRYKWDPHPGTGEFRKDGFAKVGSNGLVSFTGIPADAELTVRFHVGDNRVQVDYGYDEIEAFGDDLTDFGTTVGAFGGMSGAVPDVRLCTASEKTDDDYCSTFAYQWKTGRISGNVGTQRGHTVEIEPTTQGPIDGDTNTDMVGAYSFTGLRDGEYDVTAYSQGDYTVNGTPTQKGVAVYHDEFTDDEDTLTKYVGTADAEAARWTTTRGGLAIMGYVANDGDGNNLVRGDEAMAGVTVRLLTNVTFVRTGRNRGKLASSKEAATTETAANGLYSFTDLNDTTNYWVQVPNNGFRSLSAVNPNLSNTLSAAVYPNFPEESTYLKPMWSRTTNSVPMTRQSVEITDDKGTTNPNDDVTATLHNFALVYTDGTVAGTVSNMSGSNANIDIRVTTNTDADLVLERTTGPSGDFEVTDRMEGVYTARIEDAGWMAPKVDAASGMPDDDAADWDSNGDGTTDTGEGTAPTELTGTLSGRNDYENLGTLHVYSTSMGADDMVAHVLAKGIATPGAEVANLGDSVTGITQDASGTTAVTGITGNITFASATVRVVVGRMDAKASTTVMMGTTACPGDTCTLPYHATGGTTNTAGTETERTTEITVMVTAENGYNDHAYTFSLGRTNPVDNVLERAEILNHRTGQQATGTGGGGQTAGDPWQVTTGFADSTATTLTFDLDEVGTGDAADCGQSVSVKINGGADQDGFNATGDTDVCPNEQYRLSTGGTSGTVYEITITSQDGVAKKHYINLTAGA